jgi:hypothetical protein
MLCDFCGEEEGTDCGSLTFQCDKCTDKAGKRASKWLKFNLNPDGTADTIVTFKLNKSLVGDFNSLNQLDVRKEFIKVFEEEFNEGIDAWNEQLQDLRKQGWKV